MVVIPGRAPVAAVPGLPARGDAVRRLRVPLPPAHMPLWRRGSLLKRWRYVGVYAPELLLCVGHAHVGPIPRLWWATATPGGQLREGAGAGQVSMSAGRVSVDAPGARIALELEEGDGVETASPAGRRGNYIWTSKRAGVVVRGTAEVDGRSHRIDGPYGFVDDSAGYHAHRTTWRWSAGIGRTQDERLACWNLVAGIHDAPEASERTLWIDGEPREAGAVTFAEDLSEVSFAEGGALRFDEWCAREEKTNMLVVRSSYRQPFGRFSGQLPGGCRLLEGYGVMEYHDVRW